MYPLWNEYTRGDNGWKNIMPAEKVWPTYLTNVFLSPTFPEGFKKKTEFQVIKIYETSTTWVLDFVKIQTDFFSVCAMNYRYGGVGSPI